MAHARNVQRSRFGEVDVRRPEGNPKIGMNTLPKCVDATMPATSARAATGNKSESAVHPGIPHSSGDADAASRAGPPASSQSQPHGPGAGS